MAQKLRKIGEIGTNIELYEWAGILMSTIAVIIFLTNSVRLHEVFATGSSTFLIWDNIVGLFHAPLASVFVLVLLALLAAYYTLGNYKHHYLTNIRFIVRILASYCLMMAIYKIVNFYIDVFNPFDKDIVLQHIDRTIFFGKLPSEWIEPIICKPLTYIFFGSYMSWFILQYITMLVLLKHSRRAVREYVTAAIITFYIGYITYFFVPAIGPVFTVSYSHSLGPIVNLLTIGQSLLDRDCFPSLHTGISIVMAIYIWRYRRDLFWIYSFFATMIILSTQYLRVHYGIDVIAGAALSVCVCQCAPFWGVRFAANRKRILVPEVMVLRKLDG